MSKDTLDHYFSKRQIKWTKVEPDAAGINTELPKPSCSPSTSVTERRVKFDVDFENNEQDLFELQFDSVWFVATGPLWIL